MFVCVVCFNVLLNTCGVVSPVCYWCCLFLTVLCVCAFLRGYLLFVVCRVVVFVCVLRFLFVMFAVACHVFEVLLLLLVLLLCVLKVCLLVLCFLFVIMCVTCVC